MCTAEWWMTLFKNENHYNNWKLIYNHGQSEKYLHTALGYNFRMTNIQAAIWNTQIKKIDLLNNKRIQNANIYTNVLKKQDFIQLPKDIINGKNVFHQYTLYVKDNSPLTRDQIMEKLSSLWIPTAIHYPFPIHKQPYYVWLGYNDNICPQSTLLSKNIFSLPIYPGLKKEEVQFIADSLFSLLK
jgi:perosamine synthetase